MPGCAAPLLLALVAARRSTPAAAATTPAAPRRRRTPATASAAAPRRDPLAGGPYPALLVAQAQFVDGAGADGKPTSVPGPAKLTIVRKTESGLEAGGPRGPRQQRVPQGARVGRRRAHHRRQRRRCSAPGTSRTARGRQTTHWNPKFGGKFDRLRDIERGDVDGDGKDELVIATHDQGVIAVVHPDEDWRVEEVDRKPNTFVHEIEIGDVDGDGVPEFFATPSEPNKLDQEQPGEVRMYSHTPHGLAEVDRRRARRHARRRRSSRPTSTGDGVAELYVVVGGRGRAGQRARASGHRQAVPLEERQPWTSTVVGDGAGSPDARHGRRRRERRRQDRPRRGRAVVGSLAVRADARTAGRRPRSTPRRPASSIPSLLADLDGDGALEIYVASEDQQELRQYRWNGTAPSRRPSWRRSTKGDITWNLSAARQ